MDPNNLSNDQTSDNPQQTGNTYVSTLTPSEITRVAVKPAPFWKCNPKLWFCSPESQFVLGGISNETTKFHTVISALDQDVLLTVADIIYNPPPNPYTAIKHRLEEQYTDSEERQIKKLLCNLELGDRRPTQLLREMRELAGDKVSEQFLKSLWIQRLPVQVQTVLSVSEESLPKLAQLADKVLEISCQPEVASISRAKETSLSSDISVIKMLFG